MSPDLKQYALISLMEIGIPFISIYCGLPSDLLFGAVLVLGLCCLRFPPQHKHTAHYNCIIACF